MALSLIGGTDTSLELVTSTGTKQVIDAPELHLPDPQSDPAGYKQQSEKLMELMAEKVKTVLSVEVNLRGSDTEQEQLASKRTREMENRQKL